MTKTQFVEVLKRLYEQTERMLQHPAGLPRVCYYAAASLWIEQHVEDEDTAALREQLANLEHLGRFLFEPEE